MYYFIDSDKYVKYFLNELHSDYMTTIDYDCIFNNLDDKVVSDLENLTYFYSNIIMNTIDSKEKIIINLDTSKKIDDLDVRIFLLINKSSLRVNNNSCYIISLYTIYKKDYIEVEDDDNKLQLLSKIINVEDEDELTNDIYNFLFYSYLIYNQFSYNPLLKYIYHKDEISSIRDIKLSYINLFDNVSECCVCMEQTNLQTKCKHTLCQKCFSSLNTPKKCPVCRSKLSEHNSYTNIDIDVIML